MFTIVVATLSVNIAANVVSPANAFPRWISFRTGGLITGIAGILMQPWKLLADPSGYIFSWLLGYSGGLGSIAGVLIADYWLVRRKNLNLGDLYRAGGAYRYAGGWNWRGRRDRFGLLFRVDWTHNSNSQIFVRLRVVCRFRRLIFCSLGFDENISAARKFSRRLTGEFSKMIRKIAQILLWISVVAWSLWFGGLMYEMVVVLPLWSASLPESVIEWNNRPQYLINPTRFHAPVAVITVLSSLFGLIFGWKSVNRRVWLGLSAACAAAVLAFTIIYFFPKNEVIFRNQISGLSGEEIATIARSWTAANWGRVVLMAVGFFAALRVYNTKTPEKV